MNKKLFEVVFKYVEPVGPQYRSEVSTRMVAASKIDKVLSNFKGYHTFRTYKHVEILSITQTSENLIIL